MKDILLFTFPMNFVCICVTWIYYLHIFPLFQSLFVKRTAAIPILCQSADLLKLSTISRYCISFSIKYFIQEITKTRFTRFFLVHWFVQYILKKSISDFLSTSDFCLIWNLFSGWSGSCCSFAQFPDEQKWSGWVTIPDGKRNSSGFEKMCAWSSIFFNNRANPGMKKIVLREIIQVFQQ